VQPTPFAGGRRVRPWRLRTAGTSVLAVVAVLAASLAVVGTAGPASAAVPAFPDNIVAFPNRDFVSVEGYQDHVGETATIEVTRPGVGIVGSAEAVVAEGDVAFEINHPGGYCWGAGTNLKVTPDILPGDVVSIRFGDTPAGDTTVGDAFVNADAVQSGTTVTVTGHIGPGVNRDNTEQRIVEPALTDTAVGRRDVRALPGPLTPAPRGGYSSGLEFSGDTFTATYVFDDADVARIAANAGLGERLLSWQETDVDGNRQGLTIAEFGELGGPGMGGCPNGPLQSGPPGPTDLVAAKVAGGIRLTWTPAQAIPGTPPITGYRAHAVAQTSTGGEQVEIGRRIAGQAARGTTITGLSDIESYHVEVVAVSGVGETFPPVTAQPQTDTTPPTVTASPAGGSFAVPQTVRLQANEAGSEIYHTTDGTDPVVSDVLAPEAVQYTGPIQISADTTLKYVAFDPSGNVSDIGEQAYVITNTPVPAAPAFGTTSVGQGSITLNWTADDPSITGFAVQAFDADGNRVGDPRPTTATTLTITDLPTETPFFFTMTASNANGTGPESAKVGPLSAQGPVVAKAGPDQTVARRTTPTTVNLTGAGSTAGASYQWTQILNGANDPDRVTLQGATTLSPSFTLPLYRHPMTNNSLTFRLTVTANGVSRSDEVKVTPVPDRVTIGTARWKAGDFRVTGTGSAVGATITVHQGSLGGRVLLTAPVTAAAPPETGGVWDARARNAAAPAANPGTIWIESSVGGTAGPFTVSR
jgi:hypothetical protein